MKYRTLEFSLYAMIIAVSMAVGIWSERLNYRVYRQEMTASVTETIHSVAFKLDAKISEMVAWANGMAAVVLLNPNIDQKNFSAAADRLGANASGIRNLSLTRDYVVSRVHPVGPNSMLIGLDLRDLPGQIQGVESAMHSPQPVFLGPVDLVQGDRGFILRLALPMPSAEQSLPRPRAMISLVVDVDRFFQGIDIDLENGGADILIMAGGEVIHGTPSVRKMDPVITQLATPTASWQVYLAPKTGWPFVSPRAATIAGLGLLRTLIAIVALNIIFGLLRKRQLAEDRLMDAIESLDDGFALFDSADRLAASNRRYHEIYKTSEGLLTPGATFEEIIRGGVARGQYPDAKDREEEWIGERLAAHYSGNMLVEQKLDDGRWLKVSERKTKDGGIVGFGVDITELKLATEAARAADRAKSDFISVLSHELRTPLTIVVGYSRLIAAINLLPATKELRQVIALENSPYLAHRFDQLEAAVEGMASKVHRSAQHLLLLVDHLLDFSKIEAGMMALDLTDVDAGTLLTDVSETFKEIIEAKGLMLDVRSTQVHVRADEIRLRQILTNLLSNAMKFTDRGKILLDTKMIGEKVKFRVEDTGCGIPVEMESKVFGRFVQVDGSGVRKSGGTGLGLAICKSLVEQMGGEIGVVSSPRGGSVFWFTLPLSSKVPD